MGDEWCGVGQWVMRGVVVGLAWWWDWRGDESGVDWG